MKVIDKILNEWSFRCHDGIVDMNDPIKLSILNEVLKEHNLDEQEEQSIDDKIDTLISSLKDDEKEKIYNSLVKAKNKISGIKNKDEENIKQSLLNKQIPDNVAEYIVLKAEDKNQINELNNLINSISLKELKNKTDKNLREEAGNLNWINDITSTQGSLSIGKGELLLAILIINAIIISERGADLEVSDRKVEIKQSSDTGGAIISRSGRSNEYLKMWNDPIFKGKNGEDISFKEKWLLKGKLSTWTPIYDKFQLIENKLEFVKDINSIIQGYGFDSEGFSTQDFSSFEKFCKKAAYLLVGDYLDEKDLILMNQNLDYVILNDKEQILTDPNIKPNSAFIPRIFYKEKPIDESNQIDNL